MQTSIEGVTYYMSTITVKNNLVLHYGEVIYYPDGQRNFKLNLEKINHKQDIIIKARLKTFDELEVLLCVVKALQKNDLVIKEIQFIYLFGQRSDRAFETGMCNYFVDVIKPIIDSLKVLYKVYAPHNVRLFKQEQVIYPTSKGKYIHTIGGDDSSYRLFPAVGGACFIKTRDNKGDIKTEPSSELLRLLGFSDRGYNLVDDLCDGGRTFIEAAKIIKTYNKSSSLFVAHGIFSKGFDELLSYFDSIYTTNSYQDFVNLPKNVYVEEVI